MLVLKLTWSSFSSDRVTRPASRAGIRCLHSGPGHVKTSSTALTLAGVPRAPWGNFTIYRTISRAPGFQCLFFRSFLCVTEIVPNRSIVSKSKTSYTSTSFSFTAGGISNGLAGRPTREGPLVTEKAGFVTRPSLLEMRVRRGALTIRRGSPEKTSVPKLQTVLHAILLENITAFKSIVDTSRNCSRTTKNVFNSLE